MISRSASVGSRERGFSLIELMIAMVCTALVGGAIVAVLVAGQNAFRREPALAERTQNIRLAMSLIQNDIAMGGNEMGRWTQVFTPGLDNAGPNASDFLQILGSDGLCPSILLDNVALPADEVQTKVTALPTCYANATAPTRFVFLQGTKGTDANETTPLAVAGQPFSFGFSCPSGTAGNVRFPVGQPFLYSGKPPQLENVVPAQLARYEIVTGPAPEFIPELWRSSSGNVNPAPFCPGAVTDWQMVARGIYDMQVVYLVTNAAGALVPAAGGAPTVGAATGAPFPYGSIVRAVTVTLVARTLEPNIAGYDHTTGLGPPQTMTSTTAPRSAQVAFLGRADATEWQ